MLVVETACTVGNFALWHVSIRMNRWYATMLGKPGKLHVFCEHDGLDDCISPEEINDIDVILSTCFFIRNL